MTRCAVPDNFCVDIDVGWLHIFYHVRLWVRKKNPSRWGGRKNSLNTMVSGAWIILTLHRKVWRYMGVSKNWGTPKSSILIGFSIINHPFWGTSIFGNTHIVYIKIDRLYISIIAVYIFHIFMYRFKLWHFLPNKPTHQHLTLPNLCIQSFPKFFESGNLYWGFKHSCEFTVDHNFIPRIIGKGGDTIRALREKYDAPLHQLKVMIGHSRVDQWLDCNLWRSSWFRNLVKPFLAFCYHFTCH